MERHVGAKISGVRYISNVRRRTRSAKGDMVQCTIRESEMREKGTE